jgi:transposase InsO family protein
VPKSTWLTPEEKSAILEFHQKNPRNGYRRLCYMMIDENVAACSPRSVHRLLSEAGLLDKHTPKDSLKGKGFEQPTRANEHWHVDISYVNVCGTFYYLCSVLDGWSRFIVHHEIRESMTELDVEQIVQKALEQCLGATPRIISDRGPQFIAKDFKTYIKLSGMTHVMTSPYYPQSNGKIERWHRELKQTIRPRAPSSIGEATRLVADFVEHYNYGRLHSAIGYATPYDKLLGLDESLHCERQSKIKAASLRREEYWRRQFPIPLLPPNPVREAM